MTSKRNTNVNMNVNVNLNTCKTLVMNVTYSHRGVTNSEMLYICLTAAFGRPGHKNVK